MEPGPPPRARTWPELSRPCCSSPRLGPEASSGFWRARVRPLTQMRLRCPADFSARVCPLGCPDPSPGQGGAGTRRRAQGVPVAVPNISYGTNLQVPGRVAGLRACPGASHCLGVPRRVFRWGAPGCVPLLGCAPGACSCGAPGCGARAGSLGCPLTRLRLEAALLGCTQGVPAEGAWLRPRWRSRTLEGARMRQPRKPAPGARAESCARPGAPSPPRRPAPTPT